MEKYTFTYKGNDYLIQEGACILVHTIGVKSFGDIASPVIRYITKSYYNHAATVVKYLGELYVLEAESRGFNPDKKLTDYLNELGTGREIAVLLPNESFEFTLEEIYNSITKIANAPYGYWTLCVIQPIYQMTGKWFGHTGEYAEARPVCSQTLAFIYRRLLAIWWTYTPKDIWEKVGQYFYISFESNPTARMNFESKYK